MKVFNFGAEAVSQVLFPVMTPKSGDAQASSRASSADLSSIDPQDPQSFSRLLHADQDADRVPVGENGGSARKSAASDRSISSSNRATADAPKGGGSIKAQSRASTRADKGASAGASAPARGTQELAGSGNGPFSLSASSPSGGSTSVDVPVGPDGGLSADSQTLPSDPRLNQTPDEIALEAAAIAAAQLLAAEPSPQATEFVVSASDVSDVSDASQAQGGPTAGSAGAGNAFLDQLALRTLQASFRSSLTTQVAALASEPAGGAGQNSATFLAPFASSTGADLAAPAVPTAATAATAMAPLGASLGDASAIASNGFALVQGSANAQAESLKSLSLDASLVNLTATPAQAAAIAAAGKQLGGSASVPVQSAPDKAAPDKSTTVDPSANLQGVNNFPPLSSGVEVRASGEIFASQPDGSAEQGVSKPNAERVVSGEASTPAAPGIAQTVSPKEDSASRNGASNSFTDQNPKNPTRDTVPVIPVKVSQLSSARVSAPISKPVPLSGTLGATEKAVSKDSTVLSVLTLDETAPVKTQESGLGTVVDRGSLAQVPAPVLGGTRALSEIDSKPAVLPSVTVKGNEVWKVVTDALLRARSENPSHLAVEVRMDDGSTLGLEVRMSSTGLHASFRSESQTLLKTLEAQWSGFVTKESPEAKVTAAVFEGRSSFGNPTESNTNGGERRQQMEDAASSAALSRGSLSSKSEQGAPAAPKQITPSIRTRDGRMAVYA
jgi:hypothetical protein